MKRKSLQVLNKILIGLIIIGLIAKLYAIYLDRQVYLSSPYMIYLAFLFALILPLIFLYGIVKQSKFYYVVMSIWTFQEANMSMNFLLLGVSQYTLYNFGVIILLIAMAVISMILYIKSFSSVNEALL